MFVIDSLHLVTKFEILNVLTLKDMHILPTGEVYMYTGILAPYTIQLRISNLD